MQLRKIRSTKTTPPARNLRRLSSQPLTTCLATLIDNIGSGVIALSRRKRT